MAIETVETTFYLGELMEMEDSLEAVFDNVIKDGATTFAFATMLAEIRKKIKLFNETRAKLARAFGKDNGDGSVTLPENKVQEFNAELLSMLETEVVLQVPRVSEEDLSSISVTPIELSKVMGLFKYLTEPDQK